MEQVLNHQDLSPILKGHFRLDIYEGDVRRETISFWQRAYNLLADLRWKLLRIPSPRYYRGAVLNKKVKTIEGDNLIVTVGKQMILDRLYGLSAVGAMTRTGVGTSATAAAIGNTSLTGGVFKVFDATPIRTALAVASITTFGTGDANINWQELALDNGTTILNRIAPIGPFNKTTAVSIVVTVTVTQA